MTDLPSRIVFNTPSPILGALAPATATRIRSIFANEAVQSAASRCRGKLLHLAELAAYRSEIAQAIEDAVAADDDRNIDNVGAGSVAEMLRRRSDELDEAIEQARTDHRLHDEAVKHDLARHQPLRSAVSARLCSLIQERDHAIARVDSMRRAATMAQSTGNMRFAGLRAAGLSIEQINALGQPIDESEARIGALHARIVEIAPQVDALAAFGADLTFDAAPLAGLGFDELIAARDSHAKAVQP